MMRLTKLKYILIASLSVGSCKQGPTVISEPVSKESADETASTGIFSDQNEAIQELPKSTSPQSSMHSVKVLETLPTDKYVYLYVEEGDEKFWIATTKKEVEIGETYYYKNGILKTNFESKEHNRVFDKVYLVSNIVPANHGGEQNNSSTPSFVIEQNNDTQKIEKEGSIKISELVKNKEKYNGKEVQISGRCTKINPNIMNRNWIHLKDGSMDDFDLVITSDLAVPEGHIVTMKGTVVLDKDFGAGYKYDLIIENGKIVSTGS